MPVRFALIIVVLVAAAPAAAGSLSAVPGQVDQLTLFRMVGNLYGVDPDLLQAIAAVESGGDSGALSPKGAEGLMQLMPGTARRFGGDPFDVVDNVFGAVRYLNHLRRWESARSGNGSVSEVLAAYNAGERAVEKYGGIPPYAETQEYVRRVALAYLLIGLIRQPLSLPKPGMSPRVVYVPGTLRPDLRGSPSSPRLQSGVSHKPQPPDVFAELALIKCRREAILQGRNPGASGCDKRGEVASEHLESADSLQVRIPLPAGRDRREAPGEGPQRDAHFFRASHRDSEVLRKE